MLSNILIHELDWTKFAAIFSIIASISAILYRLAMYRRQYNDKELINYIREVLAYLEQKEKKSNK